MRHLIKTILASFVLLGLHSSMPAASNLLYAHEADPPHEHQQEQKENQPTAFTYTVPKDCSLSLLARRSLQLFDQNSGEISLSPAQAMYAETSIVKQMGDRWLEVGEKVSIEKTLVEDFAKKSQSLTADQSSAWLYYANQADFDVSYLKPDSGQSTAEAPAEAGTETATNESQDKPQSSSPAPRSSSPAWYLWLIVGATLAGMYLMMDRPRKK